MTIKQDEVERIIAEINKGYDNKAIITKNTTMKTIKQKLNKCNKESQSQNSNYIQTK